MLGRDPLPGQPPDDPDNRTLVTLLLLRQLEEATGRELPVVTELIDDRNRALAPISPGADVIISGKLIGLLLAQISQSRHLAAVFEELFSAEGSGVRLRPAPDYVLPGSETTFATVVAAARQRGECAIGYRSHDGSSTSPGYGVRINPQRRAAPLDGRGRGGRRRQGLIGRPRVERGERTDRLPHSVCRGCGWPIGRPATRRHCPQAAVPSRGGLGGLVDQPCHVSRGARQRPRGRPARSRRWPSHARP